MEKSLTDEKLILRHQPYGELHPYLPLPHERSPRDPANGEPVTINIETGHNPSADSVWCTWNSERKLSKNRVNAELLSRGQDFDHWQIHLPAFAGGELVRYTLFAKGETQKVSSEEFSFDVSSWVNINFIKSITDLDQKLVVCLTTDLDDLFVQLVMEPVSTGILSMKLNTIHGIDINGTVIQEIFTKFLGDLQLTLNRDPFTVEITPNDDRLSIKISKPMQVLVDREGHVLQYRLNFDSPADEAFFGFGERFNAFDQRGNHLDNYVYGQYTNQGKRTYIPVPFFVSSRGYGVWIQTNRQAEFDLASERSDSWWLAGYAEDDSSFELKYFFQPQPYEIVKAFTRLTGKPKMPANWVFGPWMSSNDWNSQAVVLNQLHETQKLQIPASVLVIEAWSDEINFYIWNDAQYQLKPSSEPCKLADFKFNSDSRWPNLKAMVDELHASDVRLVLWQNPVIKYALEHDISENALNQADQDYTIEQGFVVTKDDGSPHRVERHMPWFNNSLVFDFTNPKAADWWFSKREYLVSELGVDGFKTDGGEHIWDPKTRFHKGMRGSTGINQYPVDYESAYDRFMSKLRGNDFVLFSRAGYTGSQKSPCHWAGDENSTWDAFRATLHALLNVGISGLPFVGWDIAGFAGPIPSSELYLRATAFSVFCPIMQYHSDVNQLERTSRDRTPWNMQKQTGDTRIIPVFRQFANLRMNLLPYILDQAHTSSLTGLPLMRSMALVHPQDATCRKYLTQYYFGDSLLVAPIVHEGVNELSTYLPEGEWRDFWTGEILSGPREFKRFIPVDQIAVFQKKGSLIPLNLDHSGKLCSPVGNSTEKYQHLTLQIHPDGYFETQVSFAPDAAAEKVVVDSSEEGDATILLPTLSWEVILVIRIKEPETIVVNDMPLTKSNGTADNGWTWDAQRMECRFRLKPQTQTSRVVIH